jgi:hypothetical protein
METKLVAALPTCSRCGENGMTQDWFDGDQSCMMCGHVAYASEPCKDRGAPIFNFVRRRKPRPEGLIDGVVFVGKSRRRGKL